MNRLLPTFSTVSMAVLLTTIATFATNAETADSILANKKIREQSTRATPPPAVTPHIWSKRAKSLPGQNRQIDQKLCQSYTKTYSKCQLGKVLTCTKSQGGLMCNHYLVCRPTGQNC